MSAFLLLVRVAFRSLGRNRRRTLIAGAGIAVGAAMCIGTFGLIDGLDADILRGVTDLELGHAQVHAAAFAKDGARKHAIPSGDEIATAAARFPHVTAAAPRAYGWGLATREDQSAGVQMVGVDPPRERRVTTLPTKLVDGAFVPDAPTPWHEAHAWTKEQQALDESITRAELDSAIAELDALDPHGKPAVGDAGGAAPDRLRAMTTALVTQVAPPPSEPLPAVVGAKLASKLRLHVGDTFDVASQDDHGVPIDALLRVVGVFRTGTDAIDRARVLVHLGDLQHLLRIGDGVTEVALRLDDAQRAKEVAAAMRGAPAFATLDVRSWDELRPDALAMTGANDALMESLLVIVFLIAALGVVNTMLMAVFERKRELGVLKAVGMGPASIVAMIVLETSILGACASLVGLVIGAAIDGALHVFGFDVSAIGRFSLAGVGLDPVLHAEVTARGLATPAVAMFAMAVLASLYPAIAAARVEPAVGMRDLG
jgi:ABC-type lipoprotein release transport system permease subunit